MHAFSSLPDRARLFFLNIDKVFYTSPGKLVSENGCFLNIEKYNIVCDWLCGLCFFISMTGTVGTWSTHTRRLCRVGDLLSTGLIMGLFMFASMYLLEKCLGDPIKRALRDPINLAIDHCSTLVETMIVLYVFFVSMIRVKIVVSFILNIVCVFLRFWKSILISNVS